MVSLVGQKTGGKYANGLRRAHAPAPSLLKHAGYSVGYGTAATSYETKLRAKGDKDRSIETAMTHINRFGAWLDQKGMTHQDVRPGTMDEYIVHRRDVDKVGDITRRRDVIHIKAFFRHGKREQFIARNYVEDYELPSADKPYRKMPSVKELWDILVAIEDKCRPDKNPARRYRNRDFQRFFTTRDQALVALGTCSALRITEILSLQLEDYDQENMQLVVRHSKSGKPRYVPIEPDLIPFLDAWLKERFDELVLRRLEWFQGEDQWGRAIRPTLFVAENGKPMVQNFWGRQFKRYCVWAGVEGITFHCLRHYSGTNVLHVDPISAQNLMGHTELRTTMGYHHNDADHNRAALLTARPLGKVLDIGKPNRKSSLVKMKIRPVGVSRRNS